MIYNDDRIFQTIKITFDDGSTKEISLEQPEIDRLEGLFLNDVEQEALVMPWHGSIYDSENQVYYNAAKIRSIEFI